MAMMNPSDVSVKDMKKMVVGASNAELIEWMFPNKSSLQRIVVLAEIAKRLCGEDSDEFAKVRPMFGGFAPGGDID